MSAAPAEVEDRRPLIRALERSLATVPDAGPRAATVARMLPDLRLADLEASVRGGAGREATGGRLMLERTRPVAALMVTQLLELPPGRQLELLVGTTEALGLPAIVGWDVSSGDSDAHVGKLYANASDASVETRRELAETILCETGLLPHVIGLNSSWADGPELKAYAQRKTLSKRAPEALRAWAAGLDLAGVVKSSVVGEHGIITKAWFVAPRPHDDEAMARLRTLPGWDDDAVRAALPFEPGILKSVGFSADGATWTAYFKPRDAEMEGWSLDPDVVLAAGDAELGVHVEPSDVAPRAYSRTARHALTYRVRRGEPAGEDVDRAMAWVRARVEAHEAGAPLSFESPPEPWHVV